MKKILAIILALTLVFTFAACGGTSEPSNNTTKSNSAADNAQNNTGTAKSGKVLVVYFSATGSTKAVAETIAKTTGADLFELVPKDKYSSADLDWTDNNSRVNKEHDDESKQNIALENATPNSWSSYDTVFVGYPIWWGNADWPINNFIKSNSFEGKTVIPFCTSASSGLGDSAKNLSKMADSGNWLDGERFSSGVSSSDVESWVNGLGI